MKQFLRLLYAGMAMMGLWGTAQAQDNYLYNVGLIPSHLIEEANGIVRLDERKFTILSDSKGKYYQKAAYTILNEKADYLNEEVVMYDKFVKINSIKGTLYDAQGKEIRSLKKSDLIDQIAYDGFSFVSDNRLKIARLTYKDYPYTVEFEYELTYDGLMFYPEWVPQFDNRVSVQKGRMQVYTPRNGSLRYRELNFQPNTQASGLPETTDKAAQTETVRKRQEEDMDVYQWEVKELLAFENEQFSPYWREKVPYLYLAPNRFKFDDYIGTSATWKEIGQYQTKLNQGRGELPPATVNKISQLVAGIQDKKEVIRKIYEYVQGRTRYVGIQLGIGGWQPFPASFTDEKGYGDCKGLTCYTQALLKSQGIESYYTLVRAGKNEVPILPDFPDRNFNHVFLSVPLEQDTVWLECTSQTAPFNYLGSFTNDRDVLMVTPDGGKLVHTPVYDKEDNILSHKAEFVLDEQGNAQAQVKITGQALSEDWLEYAARYSGDKQKRLILNQLNIPTSFNLQVYKAYRIKGEIPRSVLEAIIGIDRLASRNGKRMFLTPNILNPLNFVPKERESRKNPLVIKGNLDQQELDTVQITIPEGFKVEYMPEALAIDKPFGSFKGEFSQEGQNLILHRRFALNRGTYPVEQYPDFVDFFKQISKFDKSKIVLVQE